MNQIRYRLLRFYEKQITNMHDDDVTYANRVLACHKYQTTLRLCTHFYAHMTTECVRECERVGLCVCVCHLRACGGNVS